MNASEWTLLEVLKVLGMLPDSAVQQTHVLLMAHSRKHTADLQILHLPKWFATSELESTAFLAREEIKLALVLICPALGASEGLAIVEAIPNAVCSLPGAFSDAVKQLQEALNDHFQVLENINHFIQKLEFSDHSERYKECLMAQSQERIVYSTYWDMLCKLLVYFITSTIRK
ncbi:hypothetical protein C8R42DRAFT_645334 [Lentinula raphanica]|nr:hypothetical protein C8R42DRAFT_645334 [Lentinula raphanica]